MEDRVKIRFSLEDRARRGRHDLELASRKAEEAALRRYQATHWLECLVGPLGISCQPSEKEFISCLRNGLILCNAINKVQPGSVLKVVESPSHSQPQTWDSQPLPAYQYFENVRNFLVAVHELKLPAFEASDIGRDNLEAGSSAKVVDCILALKAYHEWKQMNGRNGYSKPPRSPLVTQLVQKIYPRASGAFSSNTCRQLEIPADSDKKTTSETKSHKLEDLIVKAFEKCMFDSKENVGDISCHDENEDPVKIFRHILSTCLEEQLQTKFPQLKSIFKDHLRDRSSSGVHSAALPLGDLLTAKNHKSCRTCVGKDNCNHWHLFEMQEKELGNLKALLSRTKQEFAVLQSQLQIDLGQIGSQMQELSTAALGYHKVMVENRNLYNMVQDLKGNIRVYCRIRPVVNAEARNVVDYVGGDGSLVVLDPLKPQKDGRKLFQFNRVFCPTATQDEIFNNIRPLIRSVMDGYNVCIFAYGQTGSGKTHTMSGPSGGSTKELGVNILALNDLFQLSDDRKDIIKYDIQVQMVEIYNEQVRDLLVEDSSATRLEIRSCPVDNGLTLPDAAMHSVKSTIDVLDLMKLGELNRVVSSTALNDRSSRSHSILTVHVHGKDLSGSMLRSCLHLVDLAGSERVGKSEVTGDELKEAQYINRSLSALGDVVAALAQKNSYIPYRNSKLTLLLQNSLGGQAKTLMFAHVNPEADSFGETISTLKFAQRVSNVELGAARVNKGSSEIMELKEQVENLKKALANKEVEAVLRVVTERTSPCPRMLSFENGTEKLEKLANFDDKGSKTPSTSARSRRLSLESPRYASKDPASITLLEAQTSQTNKFKETRTPREKAKVIAERTPPRLRRLSIETCSTTKTEKKYSEYKKGYAKTPGMLTLSSRRFSLEGPRYANKESVSIKLPETMSKPLKLEASRQKSNKLIDADSATKQNNNIGGSGMEMNHQRTARSPTNSAYRSLMTKRDGRTRTPPPQLPKTPEPPVVVARSEAHVGMKSNLTYTGELITPILTNNSGTNGKGSQIRKSFRNIGKLINGSEKR